MIESITKIIKILNKKEKYLFYFLSLLSVLVMFLEVVGLSMIIPIISLVMSDEIINRFPEYFKMISQFTGSNNNKILQFFVIIFVLFILFKNLIIFLFFYLQNLYVEKIQKKISHKLLSTYLHMPYYKLFKSDSGTLINNINVICPHIGSFILHFLNLITEIFVISGLVLFFLITQTQNTIILITIFTVLSGLYYIIFQNKLKNWGKKRFANSSLANEILFQALTAKKDLRVSDSQDFFLKKYKEYNFIAISQIYLIRLFTSTPKLFLELLGVFLLSIILFLYSLENVTNEKLIVNLSIYVIGLAKILPSLTRIINNLSFIKISKTAINKVEKDLISLGETFKANKDKSLKIKFNKNIIFKNLDYFYPGTKKKIYKNLNFEIKKGEKIIISGESGSGKSTLLDLILGLIEPSNGLILVDNLNINQNFKSWRKKIGYVPQEVFLLKDTIKKNVVVGSNYNKINIKKIRDALKKASLGEYLNNSKKKGIEENVGENGINLSGGQKQRIAIARALFKSPEILIFDEATSGLDEETEIKIIKDILELNKKMTIIFVTHRIYLSKYFDKKYKLHNGKLKLLKNN